MLLIRAQGESPTTHEGLWLEHRVSGPTPKGIALYQPPNETAIPLPHTRRPLAEASPLTGGMTRVHASSWDIFHELGC
jgi:hypothetical protein